MISRILAIASCSFLLLSCGVPETENSEIKSFYAQSKRRPPYENEKGYITKLKGCTGFFVENSARKPFMITARHCVNFSITNWCQNRGTVTDSFGNVGTCKRVVAALNNYDIAMVELNIAHHPQRTALKLLGYTPAVGTRLKMLGFPGDKFPGDSMGRGKFTVTENCWTMSSTVNSPHSDILEQSVRHNCSTYGGNSGGPMVVENTLVAAGLPYTYEPNNYRPYAQNDLRNAAYMAQMYDFVARNYQTLVAEGVSIVRR